MWFDQTTYDLKPLVYVNGVWYKYGLYNETEDLDARGDLYKHLRTSIVSMTCLTSSYSMTKCKFS